MDFQAAQNVRGFSTILSPLGSAQAFARPELAFVRRADGAQHIILSQRGTFSPIEIGFSQRFVKSSRIDRMLGKSRTFDDLVNSMRSNGWQHDPIDVVLLPNGYMTSMDDTRLLAARHAGINVEANVHQAFAPLTRFQEVRFSQPGLPTPKTWGEALAGRIQAQPGGDYRFPFTSWGERFPKGSIYDPIIKVSPE